LNIKRDALLLLLFFYARRDRNTRTVRRPRYRHVWPPPTRGPAMRRDLSVRSVRELAAHWTVWRAMRERRTAAAKTTSSRTSRRRRRRGPRVRRRRRLTLISIAHTYRSSSSSSLSSKSSSSSSWSLSPLFVFYYIYHFFFLLLLLLYTYLRNHGKQSVELERLDHCQRSARSHKPPEFLLGFDQVSVYTIGSIV